MLETDRGGLVSECSILTNIRNVGLQSIGRSCSWELYQGQAWFDYLSLVQRFGLQRTQQSKQKDFGKARKRFQFWKKKSKPSPDETPPPNVVDITTDITNRKRRRRTRLGTYGAQGDRTALSRLEDRILPPLVQSLLREKDAYLRSVTRFDVELELAVEEFMRREPYDFRRERFLRELPSSTSLVSEVVNEKVWAIFITSRRKGEELRIKRERRRQLAVPRRRRHRRRKWLMNKMTRMVLKIGCLPWLAVRLVARQMADERLLVHPMTLTITPALGQLVLVFSATPDPDKGISQEGSTTSISVQQILRTNELYRLHVGSVEMDPSLRLHLERQNWGELISKRGTAPASKVAQRLEYLKRKRLKREIEKHRKRQRLMSLSRGRNDIVTDMPEGIQKVRTTAPKSPPSALGGRRSKRKDTIRRLISNMSFSKETHQQPPTDLLEFGSLINETDLMSPRLNQMELEPPPQNSPRVRFEQTTKAPPAPPPTREQPVFQRPQGRRWATVGVGDAQVYTREIFRDPLETLKRDSLLLPEMPPRDFFRTEKRASKENIRLAFHSDWLRLLRVLQSLETEVNSASADLVALQPSMMVGNWDIEQRLITLFFRTVESPLMFLTSGGTETSRLVQALLIVHDFLTGDDLTVSLSPAFADVIH